MEQIDTNKEDRLTNALLSLMGIEPTNEDREAYEAYKRFEQGHYEFLRELYLSAANPLCDNISIYESIILNSGYPELNYLFARDVKNANILAHGNAIINSGDAMYNIIFASEIEGADIEAHRQAIIDINDPKYDVKLFDMIFNKEVDQMIKK